MVGHLRSLVEEPRRRDVCILGEEGRGGASGALVELRSGVVLWDRKSGESVIS